MSITTLFWTYAMLRDKVLRELDLEDENFISPQELLDWANEAIDKCEQEVHTIYEDYYLDFNILAITAGVDEYPLPPTIYAHKIRRIVYFDGVTVHKIKRSGDWKKFEMYERDRVNNSGVHVFEWFIRNPSPTDARLVMNPVPTRNGQARVWFLRQANRMENPASVLDVPEGHNYVVAFMKMKCVEKQTFGEASPGLATAMAAVEVERQAMVSTLTTMVPDAENEIEPDMSHYFEMT